MATLAQFFNQFSGAKAIADAAAMPAAEERSAAYKLRAVPNEDVYFYIKRIDNSRVVRQADPRARRRDWTLLGGAGLAAACVIAVLLPSAWSLMAGYQLSHLQQDNERLHVEKARLEVEEARLVSVERLQKLANGKFVPPAPDKTVYLGKPAEEAVAQLNRR